MTIEWDVPKELNARLAKDGLNICCRGELGENPRMRFVEIGVPIKGNSKLIAELKKEGWVAHRRHKTAPVHPYRHDYSGYEMIQRMRYTLPNTETQEDLQ